MNRGVFELVWSFVLFGLFGLFIFSIGFIVTKHAPKSIPFEVRMETCNFPSYNQQLECEKIKALRR